MLSRFGVILLLFTTACIDDVVDDIVGEGLLSCDLNEAMPPVAVCSQEVTLNAVASEVNKQCGDKGGTPGTGCATTNAVGKCTVTQGERVNESFYYVPYTSEAAEMACMKLASDATFQSLP